MAGTHGTDLLGTGAPAHDRARRTPRRRFAILGLGLAAVAAVAGLSACEPIVPTDCTVDWVGPAWGDWDDPANWSAGVPDVTDVACAPAGHTIRIDDDVTVAAVAIDGTLELPTGSLTLTRRDRTSRLATLELDGGRLGGTTMVEVATLRWTGGTIDGESLLTAGSATVSGTAELRGARQFWLTGPSSLTGTLAVCDTASIRNLASSSMTDLAIGGAGCPVASPKALENRAPGAIAIAGTVTSAAVLDNQGDVSLLAGSELAAPGFAQTAGTTTIGAGAELHLPVPLVLTGGRLEGTGTVAATVTGAGAVAPGPGLGTLTIAGDLLPNPGASIELGIAGPSGAGTHDQVTVTGTADVRAAGLTVSVTTSDQPVSGQLFDLVTAAAYTGPPSTVSLPTDVFLLAGPTGLRAQVSTCDPNVYYPGVDLSFQDLTGVDLHGCDLSGADLADADLSGAILDGADLTGATLDGAWLDDASLVGTTLVAVDVTGTSLNGADFTDADLSDAYVTDDPTPPTWQSTATWANTTCPNGRNSDGLPNGCEDTFTGADCPTSTFGPYTDLSNCNLINRDLTGVDLTYADLSGAILDGADLTDATLANAYLYGASLIGTTLANVDVTATSLSDADFTDADLTNAWISSSPSQPYGQDTAIWANTTCPNGRNSDDLPNGCEDTFTGADCPTSTFGPYTDLSNCNLTGRDLTGVDLTYADLSNAILDGADLTDATLANAYLYGASLIGTTLHGTELSDASIGDTDFTGADLTNAWISSSPSQPYGQDTAIWANTTCPNGRNSDSLPNGCEDTFTGADCPTSTFGPYTDLSNCNLTGRDLTGVDLTYADLSNAILDGADLTDATLANAYLYGASLIGTTLHGTELSDASIGDTDFTGADLTNAWISSSPSQPYGQSTAIWANTTCPNGRNSDSLPNGCEDTFTGADCPTSTFGPYTDLSNCNLTGRDLTGVDLTYADLSNAILDGADLTDATLANAYLYGASLIGTTLHGTELSDASIGDTDFTGADLTNAWISSSPSQPYGQSTAIWANTTCPNGRNSDDLPNGCEDTFTGADCPTSTFGPYTDLSNCNLTGRDLTGVDLTYADLSNAILDGADLTDATLANAYLYGASLIGTTLHGTELSDASIGDTDFTGADLTNAWISSSSSQPYGQDTAIWADTTCPDGRNSDSLPNGCAGTFLVPSEAVIATDPTDTLI